MILSTILTIVHYAALLIGYTVVLAGPPAFAYVALKARMAGRPKTMIVLDLVWQYIESRERAEAAQAGPAEKLKPLPGGALRHVVVTGCDSGLGKEAALDLAGRPGYAVHAVCLTDDGVADLAAKGLPNMFPIQANVCSDDDVQEVVNSVKAQTDKLWALVNNAGIQRGTIVEATPTSTYEQVMQVNYVGSVRVARAFISLLQAGDGRVVQVGSAAGRCSIGGAGAYCASKAAIANFTTTLAIEQKAWGVDVCLLEPNHFKTPILDAAAAEWPRSYEAASPEVQGKYGRTFFEARAAGLRKKAAVSGDPQVVVDAIVDAVTNAEAFDMRNAIGENYRILKVHECLPYTWQFYGMFGKFMSEGPMPAAFGGPPPAASDKSEEEAPASGTKED